MNDWYDYGCPLREQVIAEAIMNGHIVTLRYMIAGSDNAKAGSQSATHVIADVQDKALSMIRTIFKDKPVTEQEIASVLEKMHRYYGKTIPSLWLLDENKKFDSSEITNDERIKQEAAFLNTKIGQDVGVDLDAFMGGGKQVARHGTRRSEEAPRHTEQGCGDGRELVFSNQLLSLIHI